MLVELEIHPGTGSLEDSSTLSPILFLGDDQAFIPGLEENRDKWLFWAYQPRWLPRVRKGKARPCFLGKGPVLAEATKGL